MKARATLLPIASVLLLGCGAEPRREAACPPTPVHAPGSVTAMPTPSAVERAAAVLQINRLLDDWHVAAARADEDAYFEAFDEDAVFRGTDDSERWDVPAFRKYAHPHFAAGKAWSFRPTRRAIQVSSDGKVGWFDEDLDTPNLGPARGSGVVVQRNGLWRIAHYNLSIAVPNDELDDVRKLLTGTALPGARCTSRGRRLGGASKLEPHRPPSPTADIVVPWR